MEKATIINDHAGNTGYHNDESGGTYPVLFWYINTVISDLPFFFQNLYLE